MASYEVKLNLGGNLVSQLTKAEALIDKLRAKATGFNLGGPAGLGSIGRGGGSTLSNKYGFIPNSINQALWYKWHKLLGGGLSRDQFRKELNSTFYSLSKLRAEFNKNLYTLSGWRRNLGILTEGFFQVTKAARVLSGGLLKIPGAIKIAALAAVAGGMAARYTYRNVLRTAESEEVVRGASNRALFNLSKSALGPDYDASYEAADRMAKMYGYDRAQSLGLIASMTGLGTTPLTAEQAAGLARIAGKISTLGGRPYQQVGLNLQQILSAGNNPNQRDIRELLHAVPIIAKYAQQRMRELGQPVTDVMSYLKNTQNLFAVLERLDREYQPSSLAQAKARLDLARSDKGLILESRNGETLAQVLEKETELTKYRTDAESNYLKQYAKDIADSARLWTEISKVWIDITYWFKGIVAKIGSKFAWLLDESDSDTGPYGKDIPMYKVRNRFIPKSPSKYSAEYNRAALSAMELLNDGTIRNPKSYSEKIANYLALYGAESFIKNIPGYNIGDNSKLVYENVKSGLRLIDKDKFSLTDEQIRAFYKWSLLDDNNRLTFSEADKNLYESVLLHRRPDKAANELAKRLGKYTILGTGKVVNGQVVYPSDVVKKMQNGAYLPFGYASSFGLAEGAISDKLNLPTGGGGGTGTNTTSEIERMTRGSKALIINFNDAIVKMSNHFNTGSNAQDNINLMNRELDTSISRGFQIAITNASAYLSR